MYEEADLVMISALQHLAFCERQCALIHIEQQWAENRFTVLGDLLHKTVQSAESEKRDGIIIARSLRLVSYQLGLVGQADVVEFHPCELGEGVFLPGEEGRWRPFLVEYKRGRPKQTAVDSVQLCAQALCLEEQLGLSIDEGALFYGEKRRRQSVCFDESLRTETILQIERLHNLIRSGKTPSAVYEDRCTACSLLDICNPKMTRIIQRSQYHHRLFEKDP